MSKKKYLFYTVLVLILIFILILGNIIDVGEKLYQASHVLGVCFYSLVVFLFFVLLVCPLLKIAQTPCIQGSPKQELADMNYSDFNKYLKRLNLREEELWTVRYSQDPIASLKQILNDRKQTMEKEVKQAATQVFLITSISQNGVLDFVTSVYLNFRLIRRIVEKAGRRPSNIQLVRLYFSIVTSSMIITGVDQLIGEIDLGKITNVVGMKLVGTLFKSVMNGAANAFTCLRVGYATIEYLEVGESEYKSNKSKYRKNSCQKAKDNILDVLKSGPNQLVRHLHATHDTIENSI